MTFKEFLFLFVEKNEETKYREAKYGQEEKSAADLVAELANGTFVDGSKLADTKKIIESSFTEGEIRQRFLDELGFKRNEFHLHIVSEGKNLPNWAFDNDTKKILMKSGALAIIKI